MDLPSHSDCCNALHEGELIPDSRHPGTAFGVCSKCRHTAIYRVPVVKVPEEPEPTLWVAAGLLCALIAGGLCHGGHWVAAILFLTLTGYAARRAWRANY